MSRYIDADLIEPGEIIIPCVDGTYEYVEVAYMDDIREIPTVDVVEVKHGQWIYDEEAYAHGNPYGHYECDQCGEYVPHKANFCPNCGADMRKETEDE